MVSLSPVEKKNHSENSDIQTITDKPQKAWKFLGFCFSFFWICLESRGCALQDYWCNFFFQWFATNIRIAAYAVLTSNLSEVWNITYSLARNLKPELCDSLVMKLKLQVKLAPILACFFSIYQSKCIEWIWVKRTHPETYREHILEKGT